MFRRGTRDECPKRAPDLIYRTTDGYRCMRWYAERREMLEHRFVMDAQPDEVVHHINHDRSDNRPENLLRVSRKGHGIEHRKVDDAVLVDLASEGLSQSEIGRRVGLHSSQVHRRLTRIGVFTVTARLGQEALG